MEHPVKRNLHWIDLKLTFKNESTSLWVCVGGSQPLLEMNFIILQWRFNSFVRWRMLVLQWACTSCTSNHGKQLYLTPEKSSWRLQAGRTDKWEDMKQHTFSKPFNVRVMLHCDRWFSGTWLLNVLILWKLWFRCTCMLVLVYF